MVSSRDLVRKAREWVGAPVMHQGWRKDTGCDCLGLLRGVGTELGLFPDDFWSLPGTARWKAYGREPVGDFLEGLDTVFDRSEGLEVGGIIAMRFTGWPRHCAIVGEHPHSGYTLIHAIYKRVIEERIDERRLKRIVAHYRFRGVDYER